MLDGSLARRLARSRDGTGRRWLFEVTIGGSHDLDVLRDVIADLGLPLYRLTSRLTSLDEVFLRHARSES